MPNSRKLRSSNRGFIYIHLQLEVSLVFELIAGFQSVCANGVRKSYSRIIVIVNWLVGESRSLERRDRNSYSKTDI